MASPPPQRSARQQQIQPRAPAEHQHQAQQHDAQEGGHHHPGKAEMQPGRQRQRHAQYRAHQAATPAALRRPAQCQQQPGPHIQRLVARFTHGRAQGHEGMGHAQDGKHQGARRLPPQQAAGHQIAPPERQRREEQRAHFDRLKRVQRQCQPLHGRVKARLRIGEKRGARAPGGSEPGRVEQPADPAIALQPETALQQARGRQGEVMPDMLEARIKRPRQKAMEHDQAGQKSQPHHPGAAQCRGHSHAQPPQPERLGAEGERPPQQEAAGRLGGHDQHLPDQGMHALGIQGFEHENPNAQQPQENALKAQVLRAQRAGFSLENPAPLHQKRLRCGHPMGDGHQGPQRREGFAEVPDQRKGQPAEKGVPQPKNEIAQGLRLTKNHINQRIFLWA